MQRSCCGDGTWSGGPRVPWCQATEVKGRSPVPFPRTGCSHFREEATPFLCGVPPGRGWGHLVASLLGASHPASPAGTHSPGQSLSWNPGWDCGHFNRGWWPFQACAPRGPGSFCFCTVGSPELPHRQRTHRKGVALGTWKDTTVPASQWSTAHQMTTLKRAGDPRADPAQGASPCANKVVVVVSH